jgi:hypothetical protein
VVDTPAPHPDARSPLIPEDPDILILGAGLSAITEQPDQRGSVA